MYQVGKRFNVLAKDQLSSVRKGSVTKNIVMIVRMPNAFLGTGLLVMATEMDFSTEVMAMGMPTATKTLDLSTATIMETVS